MNNSYNSLMAELLAFEAKAYDVANEDSEGLTSLDFYLWINEINNIKSIIHNPGESRLNTNEFKNILTKCNSLIMIYQAIINDKVSYLTEFKRLAVERLSFDEAKEIKNEALKYKMHVVFEREQKQNEVGQN